ncbi:TRAP transporter substrate-binding protein [Bacillus sp. Marseille-P3661]|uniref:TRAP transporter substrate-binding protein n=1 Tax=Bacillus sp. Marseille-P3661 TaxID=1936234 RepID=UPI000C866462|nr:TRAP transporter substrate-binding protein [Bacillus sp. Marseille-P3661]
MNRYRIPFVSFIVLMMLTVSACSSSSTGSEPSPEGKGSSGETFEFKLGHMNSPDHVQDDVKTAWAEEVAAATENRVIFDIYPGGALGGPKETYDNVVTGIMDAGWGIQGYNAGKFPVHSVLHLPFMTDGNAAELSVVAQKLYETFPEIQAEYSEVKPLWFHAVDPYMIITKGKAVRSFEDVKGLKLRTPSVEGSGMIESWGATPVSLPAPEMYDALQKGVIDGGVLPISAIADFNLFDVVDYVTLGNFNTNLYYTVMNKGSWDKLPADDQATIEGLVGLQMAQKAGEAYDGQKAAAEAKAKEMGVEFIELPDEEVQKYKDASQVVAEKWIADMEAKGIPGQAIYDEAVKLISEN